MPLPVKEMPHAHRAVEGVFKPRDSVITVIDLPKYLGIDESSDDNKDLFIITNFNKMFIAFRVHAVVGIHRIKWSDIQKPDKIIYSGEDGVATGLADCKNHLITILDFEKIIADIAPETTIKIVDVERLGERVTHYGKILIAEDSVLLSKLIHDCLHQAKYINTEKFDNGHELWEYLSDIRENEEKLNEIDCIITDVEMPRMDGHRLTKLIKDDKVLKKIPVVIFSSLINPEMYRKGLEVGANEQLTKPEIAKLITILDRFIDEKEGAK